MAQETRVELRAVRGLIGGEWRKGPRALPVRYPYDGSTVAEVYETATEEVAAAVESAHQAWLSWRRAASHERAELLAAIAAGMAGRSEELAEVMTLETGKTIRESRTEVSRSLSTIAISAEEAKRISGEVIPMDAVPPGTGKVGFTMRVPMGVVAGITPFNAPLNTICHKLGPALAAGNTLVLKPHPQGAGLAVELAQICLQAGLPRGAFNVVHGGAEVGKALTTHPLVAVVNFTGSARVADQIIRTVGLKRTLLELGGTAPTIVHSDADLQQAVPQCVEAAFGLSGQSCISTQRIYVHRELYEPFIREFVAAARAKRAGDPKDPDTGIGPMIDPEAATRVKEWIDAAVRDGATLECGGQLRGALLEATVLTDVTPQMKVVCEEVFGPVVTVTPYDDIEQAIAQANDSPFGLKSGIFTNTLDVALRAARELEYGTVNVNGASRSRVDHEPSGGVKLSGWGKEGPRYAIEEMTYLRMVSIATS